jgi:trehalose 6-phosphate phosphatase
MMMAANVHAGEGKAPPPFQLLCGGDCGLLLDFDGTLVELAERPEQVMVLPSMLSVLGQLQHLLNGRLALVSGRPIAQLDTLLAPLLLPAAGVHGMERRGVDGVLQRAAAPDLSAVRQAAVELGGRHPGLWVEEKNGALALHYRQAPGLGPQCRVALARVLEQTPGHGLVLLDGKMVVEVKPAGIDKGTAVRDFLADPPFAGHPALFAGDDVTDESAFAVVQQRGGAGIKVGPGASIAHFRIDGPGTLLAALEQVVRSLSSSLSLP